MKKSIHEAHNWVKHHPYKAIIFSTLTGILATWDGTRPYLTTADCLLAVWLLFVVAGNVWSDLRQMRRIVPLLLALCLFVEPIEVRAQSKQPASGTVVIVVLVLVVGGVIVFRTARFCQRAFPRTPPPNTNAPPALAMGAVSGSYALSTSCSAFGGCYTASSALAVNPQETVVEISGSMVERPEGGFMFQMDELKKLDTQTESVDAMEFALSMIPWGVHIGSAGETFYGLNGQPSAPDQVPLSVVLNGANSVVTAVTGNGGQETFVFERSGDLIHWEPMLTMTINVGQRVRFADATDGQQMFYRGRTLVGD